MTRLSGPIAYLLALLLLVALWSLLGQPRAVQPAGLTAGQKLQCVSYAPFEKAQSPFDLDDGLTISERRIEQDLALLSQRFECVRTYSVTGLEAVPKLAGKFGLKVLLGAWVSADPVATRKELERVIALAKQHPAVVRAVIVGNETLLRKEVTGAQLASYLRQVKAALPEVPVTYADVWEFWLKHPEVAPATDFVTIHILPYWEDDPASIDTAIAHISQVYGEVTEQIPGKRLLIGETGWPSAGRMREGALPSLTNQARFIRGFVQLAEQQGWQYNLIEAFDQPWKRINEGAAGGYWGLYDTHRADKGVLSGAVSHFAQWRTLLLLSAFAVALCLPLLIQPRRLPTARWALVIATLVAGALLLAMQADQFSQSARNGWEDAWAAFIMALSLGVYLLTIQALTGGQIAPPLPIATLLDPTAHRTRFDLPWLNGWLRAAILFCALVENTGLVFNARYLSFNSQAFVLPALAYLWLFRRPVTSANASLIERHIALFLTFSAGFILLNETPLNLQADLWLLVTLLLAWPLWRESPGQRLSALRPMLIAGVTAYAAAASVRYGLMESVEMVNRCAEAAHGLSCTLRTGMGLIIHWRLLGWLSLGIALLAVTRRSRRLGILALMLGILGLVLYNAAQATFALVLAFLLLSWLAARSPSTR